MNICREKIPGLSQPGPQRSVRAGCMQKSKGAIVEELLNVQNLEVHFPIKQGILARTTSYVHAVDGVSLPCTEGKSSALSAKAAVEKPRQDSPLSAWLSRPVERCFSGRRSGRHDRCANEALRQKLQIIFQDPYSSLNPRMTLARILAEPMNIHGRYQGAEQKERIAHLLE
jgi:ABC-type microcin C transport system duplicated ATPase subunit YejF